MGTLDNKIAIVTGSGSGIGRAIAVRLAAEGATVVVGDLNEAAARETAAMLGNDSVGILADVTSRDSIDALVAQVIERFGTIDVLVNNAGWDKVQPFIDSVVEDWDRIMAINLYGTLHTSQAVLPILIANGSGSIVNVASDAGRVGSSGEAVYSAAKGGIIAFSKTLAREVSRHQIRVNTVSPGPTDTPLFAGISAENPRLREALEKAIPLRRLAEPEDLANAVAFFAADSSAYITGQTLSVSGGLTMS